MQSKIIKKQRNFFVLFMAYIILNLTVLSPTYAAFEPMLDETAMDLTADPCEDFEKYACGKWDARTIIPADKPSWNRSFTSIDEENLKINKEMLENFASGKDLNLTPNTKKLGHFYAACIDTSNIIKNSKSFLTVQSAQVDSITSKSLSKIIGSLHRNGIAVFMNFGSDQDYNNSSQMIASLDQGGLGLPSPDYYFDESQSPIREKYIQHIAHMFELIGIPQKTALSNAQSVMKFETDLAQKALRPVQRRDPKNMYHIQSLAQLQQTTSNIDWNILFQAMGSPKFETLNVAVPDFFTNLNSLLSKTPLSEIKSYILWQIISYYSTDLGGKFAKEHFEFFDKTLKGQQEIKPRWQYCVEEADDALADALGQAFVAKTFSAAAKEKALSILNSIQKVYEKDFAQIDWMDEHTRQYAIEKLNAIRKKIGYPDTWRDLSKLTIGKNHLENIKAADNFAHNWELSKIDKPVDRSEWNMTPDTVNAYYGPSNNEIVFPAGILQSPIFSVTAPMAANYGAFGAVIGHEITHGFDDEGRQFDVNGNLKDWWSPGIDKIFDEKTQCLINQYSQYTVAGVHVDGKLTLGENIADLGGVKMALAALRASFPPDISETDKIAEEKKFFISFGQVWCAKSTPEYEKLRVTTDPHSPPKFRINGVLTNIPEFAKTFSCETDKTLAPETRCSIW